MILLTAALKGGVGKTTTSVYLAALAGSRRPVHLVDADPQASAADWVEHAADDRLTKVEVVEAPTERLLAKALDRVPPDGIGIVDMPPSHERLLAKALDRADVVLLPTRVGGVETPRVEFVLDLVPDGLPVGLVICSARTFTRSYQESVQVWSGAGVPIWGTIPERVAITAGPSGPLSFDGLESYRRVWRRAQAAARSAG